MHCTQTHDIITHHVASRKLHSTLVRDESKNSKYLTMGVKTVLTL